MSGALKTCLLLFMTSFGSAAVGYAQFCGAFSSAPEMAITDAGVLEDTIQVLSGPGQVLLSLEVGLHISHDFFADLQIELQSPSGTVVPLFLNRCALTGLVDVVLSDSALLPVCSDTLTGHVAPPDGQLSGFLFEPVDGAWVLRVKDQFAGDSGVLHNWCLIPVVQVPDCIAPSQLEIIDKTTVSALLEWTDMNFPSPGYWEVEVSEAVFPFATLPVATATSAQFEIQNLQPAAAYSARVRAVCTNSPGSWSAPLTFTTQLPNPTPCPTLIPIPDNSCDGTNTFEIRVDSTPGDALGENVRLTQLRLSAQHSWMADLDITLTSPQGKSVLVSSDNGGSGDNFGIPDDSTCTALTFFSSRACNALPITTGVAPFLGTYSPEQSFDEFSDGSNPAGIWKLTICDDSGDDAGFLTYAQLIFETVTCDPPSDLAVLSAGPDSLTLTWSEPPGCQGLILEYGPPAGTAGTDSMPGDPLNVVVSLPCQMPQPYVLSGLDELTEYELTIRSVCPDSGFSENACPVTVKTDCRTSAITGIETFDSQSFCGTSCLDKCQISGIWRNIESDDLDWLVNAGTTPSPYTGPPSGFNGSGRYAYMEASSPCVDSGRAVLLSNCLVVDPDVQTCQFAFYAFLDGEDVGTLQLEASTNSGKNWLPVFELNGEQGSEWKRYFVDLSVFAQDTIQLRFVASKSTTGPYGDIALDELTFFGVEDLGAPQTTVFRDTDGDGYGDPHSALLICRQTPPAGYVFVAGDCNDQNAEVNPDSPEQPCNGVDENCNGSADDLLIPAPDVRGDTICLNEEATLLGFPAFSGQLLWYDAPDASQPFAIGDETVVAPASDQVYYVSEQVADLGCLSPRTAVGVKVLERPELLVPDTLNWCEGDLISPADLPGVDTAGTGTTPSWYLDISLSADSRFEQPIIANQNQNFFAFAITSAGCADTAVLSLQIDSYPEVTIEGANPLVLCSGRPALLTSQVNYQGNQPISRVWTGGFTESELAIFGSPVPGTTQQVVLSVTTASGCSDADTIQVITEPALSMVSIQNVTPVSVCGASDGQFSVAVLNGQPPFQMSWSGPVSGSVSDSSVLTANQLPQGAYRVTVTDQSGANCPFVLPVTVIDGPQIQLSAVEVLPESCFGASDGSVEIEFATGQPDIIWDTGDTSSFVDELQPGAYSVTLTDVNCQLILDSLIVEAALPLSIVNSLSVPVSCSGQDDGAIFLVATGGTMPYHFFWSDGQQGANRTGLSGGDYTVTLTDSKGCSLAQTISVAEPDLLDFSYAVNQVKCYGAKDGGILVQPAGGTEPYQITWNDGHNSFERDKLPAGSYEWTITDSRGCAVESGPINVSQPDSLQIFIDSLRPATCNASHDGFVKVSAQGGTPGYSWIWSTGLSGPMLDQLSADTYQVLLLDANGCKLNSGPIPVPGPQVLSLNLEQLKQPTCIGRNDGQIQLLPSGGKPPLQQVWSSGDTGDIADSLGAGLYTCTLTDANGCVLVSQPLELVQPQVLSLVIDAQKDAACFGENSGSIFLTTTGGQGPYSYHWSDGSILEDRKKLQAATYAVTVTDQQGCQRESADVSIGQPDSLNVMVLNVENVVCSGEENGSIDLLVQGGSPPYSFSWNTTATTEDVSNLAAGVYKATVLDKNGCAQTTDPVVVSEPSPLEILLLDVGAVNCDGGSGGFADVTVSGGEAPYLYLWSDGSSSQDLFNVTAGGYSLTVTDDRNCQAILPLVQIDNPTDSFYILLDSIRPVSCFGASDGSITASLQGGEGPYSILWNNGNDSSLTITNLGPGKYAVMVTDGNGCQASSSPVTLLNPPPLLVSVVGVEQPSCYGAFDGGILLNVTGAGGYQFVWKNAGGDTVSVQQHLSGVGAGLYSCTVVDSNNCQGTSVPIQLLWPDALSIETTGMTPSCPGLATGSLAVGGQGGQPGYTYVWSNGASGAVANLLSGGFYSVTLTDQAGCSLVQDSLFVSDLPGLPLQGTLQEIRHISCKDGSDGNIVIEVDGGLQPLDILWSNGESDLELTGLAAGSYTVTITDQQGCSVSMPEIVLEQPAEALELQLIQNLGNLCPDNSDGLLEVLVTGGLPPYTLQWSHGDTGLTVSGLTEGYYSVVYADSNGCVLESPDYYVNAPPSFQIAISSHPSSALVPNGSATIAVIGGTPPYTFNWDASTGFQDSSTAVQLSAGVYSVTISDALACDTTVTVEVQLATSTTQPLNGNLSLRVSPNPTSGPLMLHNDGPAITQAEISLVDVKAGFQLEHTTKLEAYSSLRLDLSRLADGAYLLIVRVPGADSVWARRILKIGGSH